MNQNLHPAFRNMKLPLLILSVFGLFGCAGVSWSTVGSSLITDVQDGTVLATEAYAAYQGVNQNLTTANVLTGKLNPTKVLAAATAINSGLQTPGLATAVNQFVSDANATITALKGSGATTQATINSVSDSGASTVTTIKAIAPTAPTAYADPKGWDDGKALTVN